MQALQSGLTYLHVIFGFTGLAAFWVPLLTRKGSTVHRQFGRVYVYCAYVVLASAGMSVVLGLMAYAGDGRSVAESPNGFSFLVFLGYLAVVTFVVIHHGQGVLQAKGQPQLLKTPVRVGLAWLCIAASLGLVAVVLIVNPGVKVILLALSPIGFFSGTGILSYLNNSDASPKAWLYEHLGAMLGGGIAFHTAFAVFGANRMFDIDLSGWVSAVPWVAPAALGIPATVIWTRYYRRKFGELT